MDNNKTEVTDMYLASALMSYGAELDHIDKTNKKRQTFVFVGKIQRILVYTDNGFYIIIEEPSFEEIKAKYEAKRLFFPPSYPDSVRSIKSSIHS